MSQVLTLQKIIRQLSQERLCVTAKIPNLEIKDCAFPDDLIYGSWTSLILVAGSPFKLVFKAHFKCGQLRSLLSQLNKTPFEQLHDDFAMDHMREFCNLIAGGVKACFTNVDIACGISLPLVISGFDEVLYKANIKPAVVQDMWSLDWGSGSIICSSSIEIFNQGKIDEITLVNPTDSADDEDAFL